MIYLNYSKAVVFCLKRFLEFCTRRYFLNRFPILYQQIEALVGKFGLVVVTREGSNPYKFIYESDVLTRHQVQYALLSAFWPTWCFYARMFILTTVLVCCYSLTHSVPNDVYHIYSCQYGICRKPNLAEAYCIM